jgi:hypothetical protein
LHFTEGHFLTFAFLYFTNTYYIVFEQAFETRYPQYDVIREAAGSRACARKITDLGKQADVMASADFRVIDNLLMPKYARFNIHFATNEMVIAYTEASRFSHEINRNNWPEILMRPKIGMDTKELGEGDFYTFENMYLKDSTFILLAMIPKSFRIKSTIIVCSAISF